MPSSEGWKNLKPLSERTPEELHEMRSRGGRSTAEKYKRRKAQKEILWQILSLPYTDPDRVKLMKSIGLEGDFADAINMAVAEKAARGDVESARYVRDTIGEKPREGVELLDLRERPVDTLDLQSMSDDALAALASYKAADAEA